MTQKQLADLSGVSRVAIARYETGKQAPKKEALEKLAKALDVSVEELTIEARDENVQQTKLPFDTEPKEVEPKEVEPKEIQNTNPRTEKSPIDLAIDILKKELETYKPSELAISTLASNEDLKRKLWEAITSAMLNDKEFKEDIVNVIAKHLAKTIDGKNATDEKK